MEIAMRGIGVSPGIAIGPALTFGVQTLDIPKHDVSDVDAELQRFEVAIAATRGDIEELCEKTARHLGEKHADIFRAHLAILEDVTFREDIQRRVRDEGVNAEFLVNDFISRSAQAIADVGDATFQERAKDLMDVGNRLLARLLNTQVNSLENLSKPCIIAARDLSPSDTAKLDTERALGIVTDLSGPTSHTAILARALEIPAVVGLKYAGQHIVPGDTIVVDGNRGRIIIRPSEETLREMEEQRDRLTEKREALLAVETEALNVTLDGVEIPTLANIELPMEVSHGVRNKAQGVGLYRTEYLFLNRHSLPTEEEQYQAYRAVVEAMNPHPVVLRTLDLGGDKFASNINIAAEINPQLGWRAIRFCLERPDIFKTQLRALLRASAHGDVRIMFPLVSGVDEFELVMEFTRGVMGDLEKRGVAFNREVKVGTMIEVPSAVAMAEELAERCDFFSVGTNDLIQYSLAVDRGNEKIAHMYEPAHPAVLRMLRQTAKAARRARIPCSICGEMAGDPLFTELLVGLGFTSLSMSAVAIPLVRAEVSSIHVSRARRFARRVLGMWSAPEIRALMVRRFRARQGESEYGEAVEAAIDQNESWSD